MQGVVEQALEKLAATKAQHVFPSTSKKVKDGGDHFPIDTEGRARNALARANQFDAAPPWYDGSLAELKNAVADAVEKKYPGIKVTEESRK